MTAEGGGGDTNNWYIPALEWKNVLGKTQIDMWRNHRYAITTGQPVSIQIPVTVTPRVGVPGFTEDLSINNW